MGKFSGTIGRLIDKAMESTLLRQCLAQGKYSVFDEEAALKERADRRDRLSWINGSRKTQDDKDT